MPLEFSRRALSPKWNVAEVEFRKLWFHRGGISEFLISPRWTFGFWLLTRKKKTFFFKPGRDFWPPEFLTPVFLTPRISDPRQFWPRNGHGFSPEFCEVAGRQLCLQDFEPIYWARKIYQKFTKYRVYANKWHSNRGPSRERQAQPCPRPRSFLKKLQKSWHGRFFHTFSQITLSIAQREHPTPATPPTGRFVTMNIREYTWNHGPAPGKQVTPSTQRGGDPARRLRTSTQRTRFEGMLATLNGFGF